MRDQLFDRLQDVAGPVSRETFDRLEAFEALFRRWAARINLAAPSTLENIWERHILDSAQLIRLAPPAADHWLDLGTGGGFPGVVVAILLKGRESGQVDLVESNRKKAAFLQTAVAQVGAPGRVHACRIDQVAIRQPDILIARALAPLPLLLELSERWLSTGSRALFHKGRGYRADVEESRNAWRFDLVEHPNVVSSDGMILEIARLRRL